MSEQKAEATTSTLVFYCNGERVEDTNVRPEQTLLGYIRNNLGLTGSKLGCGEGGCGACTVMVSHWDEAAERVVHRAVNACLAPLPSVHGCHVITVEGIGSVKTGLHPIQQRMYELHGSQCGFCTPGIIMAMYAFLRNNPEASAEEFEEAMDGNLCRCTGYRPILDAARSLAQREGGGCCGGGGAGGGCCMDKSSEESKSSDSSGKQGGCCGGGGGGGGGGCGDGESNKDDESCEGVRTVTSCSASKIAKYQPYSATEAAKSELIFPPELRKVSRRGLYFRSDVCAWFVPSTETELLELVQEHPGCKLVVGNTEVGIEVKFFGRNYPVRVGVGELSVLRELAVRPNPDQKDHLELVIGAAVTLSTLRGFLLQLCEASEDPKNPHGVNHTHVPLFRAFLEQLRWFSSRQIRNTACVGGNIATASPISDLNPLWQAAGASFQLKGLETKENGVRFVHSRRVLARDFFLGYRKTALASHEIIHAVYMPLLYSGMVDPVLPPTTEGPEVFETLVSFKQARRRDDDIAIVSAGMWVRLVRGEKKEQLDSGRSSVLRGSGELKDLGTGCPPTPRHSSVDGQVIPDGLQHWRIAGLRLSFGGMAPFTRRMPRVEAALLGHHWSARTYRRGLDMLSEHLHLKVPTPGGMEEYRTTLAASFWFKFYCAVCRRRSDLNRARRLLSGSITDESFGTPVGGLVSFPAEHLSAVTRLHRGVSSGRQSMQVAVARSDPVLIGGGGGGSVDLSRDEGEELTPFPLPAHKPADAVVGKSKPHSSGREHCTGEAKYTDDIAMPSGTLHACLVLSSQPYARVTKIDREKALSSPGVVAVITAADMQKAGSGLHNVTGDIVADEEVLASEIVYTCGQPVAIVVAQSLEQARRAMFHVEVSYAPVLDDMGAKVAPILSIQEAIQRKSFFQFFGDMPHILDSKVWQARIGTGAESKQGAPSSVRKEVGKPAGNGGGGGSKNSQLGEVWQQKAGGSGGGESTSQSQVSKVGILSGERKQDGDDGAQWLRENEEIGTQLVADWRQRFDHVLSGEGNVGGQEHFYLEVHNAVAIPEEGGMRVLASTQNPAKTQEHVAHVCGIAAHKVVVSIKRMGGAFGGKETRSINVACLAALSARILDRPVKLCLERDQDMLMTGARHPFHIRYHVAFSAQGKFKGLFARIYNNGGWSHDLSVPVLDRACFHIDNCYHWGERVRVEGFCCKTNLPSNTAFRGFGGPQGMVVTEMIVEQVARFLKQPVELIRQQNFYREAQRTHFGQPLLQNNILKCWNACKQVSRFEQVRRECQDFNQKNRFRKRGVALIPTKFGIAFTAKFLNQGGALVLVYTDGSVLVSHGGTEMGQGLHTKMRQVAAQALGIPLKLVHINETNTDKVPNTSPTAASFSSDINGYAILDACAQLNRRLQETRKRHNTAYQAALARKARPDSPTTQWKVLVELAYRERVNLSAQGFHCVPGVGFDFSTGKGTPFRYFTYGTAFSQVEVDVLTGDFHILAVNVVMDLGLSLNPELDVGQIEGAFAQGVGLFCMEELVFGDNQHKWVRPGALQTKGPGAYKLPGFNDVPIDFGIYLLKDAPNPRSLHSSKAVGEPPLFMGSAVFFAIKDALMHARMQNGRGPGYFRLDSPATSERIRMASKDHITEKVVAKSDEEEYQPKISI